MPSAAGDGLETGWKDGKACLALSLPAPFSSRKNSLWPSVPDPAHSSLGSWVPNIPAEVRTLGEEGHGTGGVGPGSK